MNKPYLLIAGDDYYPDSGTGDWIGCYKTLEEAESKVEVEKNQALCFKYIISGSYFDWYQIVDLRKWTE